MLPTYRGLTWDHPRGYNALAAAADLRRDVDGVSIAWDKQPLEGFESHPIADLCARYDLVVLDHPHVGEALEAGCLVPLEEVFDASRLAALDAASIGPSAASYVMEGRHWALPLDAATQVCAYRDDLLDGAAPPMTWDEVRLLSEATGRVALSLAGPHAILSFLSIATAFGEPPAEVDPAVLVSPEIGLGAYDLMRELTARSPRAVRALNPVGILDGMLRDDAVALCPLIYGYVNYAAPARGRAIGFADAPRRAPGSRPGSTLGGTGIALCKRCPVTPELRSHLLWLMSPQAQVGFIPRHDGQPSATAAWTDDGVNALWNDFYRRTHDSLDQAYVRPRHNGYIAFQSRASAILNEALDEGRPAAAVLDRLQNLYARSRMRRMT